MAVKERDGVSVLGRRTRTHKGLEMETVTEWKKKTERHWERSWGGGQGPWILSDRESSKVLEPGVTGLKLDCLGGIGGGRLVVP